MTTSPVLLVSFTGIFFAVASTILAFGFAANHRKEVGRSLGTISSMSLQGSRVGVPDEGSTLSRALRGMSAKLQVLAFRLSPDGAAQAVAHRLDLAGNPAAYDVSRVFALKGAGLVGGALVGGYLGGSLVKAVLFMVVGGAVCFWLPDILIKNVGIKRQDAIRRACADALDLLVISVEAGLAFDAALAQVAKKTEGPLASEFVRVLQEMQIGRSRGQAFRSLGERTSAPEVKNFVSSLVQADKLGIPIANVLREQAKEMRLKRRQHAEEQAMKVPVKILFPMVSCILPAMFVIILGPGAITIVRTLGG